MLTNLSDLYSQKTKGFPQDVSQQMVARVGSLTASLHQSCGPMHSPLVCLPCQAGARAEGLSAASGLDSMSWHVHKATIVGKVRYGMARLLSASDLLETDQIQETSQ